MILAVPFTVLRKVQLKADLPKGLERFIQRAELGRNEKIFAGVHEKFWRRANGFSVDGWSDLGFSGFWDGTQHQADRSDGALTLFLGGREVDEMAKRTAKFQGRRLIERLDGVLPGAVVSTTLAPDPGAHP